MESGDKALGANERVTVSIEGEMAGDGDLRGEDDGEDSTIVAVPSTQRESRQHG